MMKVLVGVLLIVGMVENSFSQSFEFDPYGIPVYVQGAPVGHPFVGGLYNPAHQFVDIDSDGDVDLFLFDSNDLSFSFYRNIGTPGNAVFRMERPSFALPTIRGWFRFSDVDGDGLLDLLTGGYILNSVAVYRNTGTPTVPLFALLTSGLHDSANNLVYVQVQCIPALIDIDGDGDLDFFSLNPSIGTINFYENIGGPANFLLAFRTDFWQGIQICPGCGLRPDATQHGQGTMYFGDVDGDSDFDMFYGDLFDSGLFFYQNIGTPAVAILDSVSGHFPPAAPVVTAGFNQPTLVDIDGDGDLDLFVSVLPPFQRFDNFYYYQNAGTPSAFDFQLVTRNFLQTLNLGLQSVPTFADVDGDGDMDMFVGDLFGKIAFFQNTGTAHSASFALEDSAFVSSATRFGYAPAFADIDGDGDVDMFAGHFAGNIEFFRNTGTPTIPQFQREAAFFDSINVGLYAAPAFFDIDGDGDLDLFVGKGDGRIAFYRNTGTAQQWSYVLESTSFQNITVGFNAKPVFHDVNANGRMDLLVGSMEGKLFHYRNEGPDGNPTFVLLTDNFGNINPAMELAPALVDIDADGDPDLIVGNLRGGLEFYRNTTSTSVRENESSQRPAHTFLHQNYPNPFNPETRIVYIVGSRELVTLKVYDVLGREIATLVDEVKDPGEYEVTFSTADGNAAGLASGVYLYRLHSGGYTETRKFVVIR